MTAHGAYAARLCRFLIIGLCRLATGIRITWLFNPAPDESRIFFANHSSHLDGVVIWSGLPDEMRRRTWIVAARDYWQKGRMRRYLAQHVFNIVLIDRKPSAATHEHMFEPLTEMLNEGKSLIIFPEGTRSKDDSIGPFKSGLHRLASLNPHAGLIPVYLENLNRVLPRGSALIVPVICSATFGQPLAPLNPGEEPKRVFLARARQSIINLTDQRHD